MAFHCGVDIAPIVGCGEVVLAPHAGKVSTIYFDPKGYGNQIDILSPIENGLAYLSTLAHLTEKN
jgi:murein DD-endopeptidase MepM/ murein hydrolase activator NlpD